MAKPPPSGPHTDIKNSPNGPREGATNLDANLGNAKEKQEAEEHSAGRPTQSAQKPGGED